MSFQKKISLPSTTPSTSSCSHWEESPIKMQILQVGFILLLSDNGSMNQRTIKHPEEREVFL